MALDLGFTVHSCGKQYVYTTTNITEEAINKVRTGLQLEDIAVLRRNGKTPILRKIFNETLPARAKTETMMRWKISAEYGKEYFEVLRKDELTPADRQMIVTEMRDDLIPRLEEAGYECKGDWAAQHEDAE